MPSLVNIFLLYIDLAVLVGKKLGGVKTVSPYLFVAN